MTEDKTIDLAQLDAPFSETQIEWKVVRAGEKNGKIWALVAPYISARAIHQRLDDVCGKARWKNMFAPGPAGGVLCGISINCDGGTWITKFNGADNTAMEAVKGGLSDAEKRAAVEWGIGRYLHKLDRFWGIIDPEGRFSGKTKDKRIFRWDSPKLPAWALPAEPQEEKEKICQS